MKRCSKCNNFDYDDEFNESDPLPICKKCKHKFRRKLKECYDMINMRTKILFIITIILLILFCSYAYAGDASVLDANPGFKEEAQRKGVFGAAADTGGGGETQPSLTSYGPPSFWEKYQDNSPENTSGWGGGFKWTGTADAGIAEVWCDGGNQVYELNLAGAELTNYTGTMSGYMIELNPDDPTNHEWLKVSIFDQDTTGFANLAYIPNSQVGTMYDMWNDWQTEEQNAGNLTTVSNQWGVDAQVLKDSIFKKKE